MDETPGFDGTSRVDKGRATSSGRAGPGPESSGTRGRGFRGGTVQSRDGTPTLTHPDGQPQDGTGGVVSEVDGGR